MFGLWVRGSLLQLRSDLLLTTRSPLYGKSRCCRDREDRGAPFGSIEGTELGALESMRLCKCRSARYTRKYDSQRYSLRFSERNINFSGSKRQKPTARHARNHDSQRHQRHSLRLSEQNNLFSGSTYTLKHARFTEYEQHQNKHKLIW